MSKKGFTLAEVLVTLAVIGIVASLTIPSLIKNYQEKAFKTKWKKTYSVISQAFSGIAADNDGTWINCVNNVNDLRNLLADQLKVIHKCWATEPNNPCWTQDNYYTLSGEARNGINYSGLVLANGATLINHNMTNNCYFPWTSPNEYANANIKVGISPDFCTKLEIDVNGPKGPNVIGKDIFGMWVLKNKTAPFGAPGDWFSTNDTCDETGIGARCSYKYLLE